MGREIKRVPTDFSHPIGEVWDGYLPPDVRDCPDCDNGATTARDYLGSLAHLILVTANDARRGECHPWTHKIPLSPDAPPSEDMLELSEGLAGRPCDFMGHDAIDRWNATKAIIEAAGLDPEEWGICDTCGGNAIHPDDQGKQEGWERTDPPTGEGWQVWETVSEGAPITPVCGDKEAMIEHLAAHGTEWDDPFPRERAETFVDAQWTPSMIMSPEHGVEKGTEALDHQ